MRGALGEASCVGSVYLAPLHPLCAPAKYLPWLGAGLSLGLSCSCASASASASRHCNPLPQIRQRLWVRNGQQLLRLEAFYSSPFW